MAPHSVALRGLGLATIVYAGVLLVEPVLALRAVHALGPVYEAIVNADPQAQAQLAAAGVTPAQAAGEARRHMLRGAWEQVAPAVVLSAVGLLGGALLALRRRAGPWIVVAFAIWPAITWAAGGIQRALSPWSGPVGTVELARRVIQLRLLGRSFAIDAAAYRTAVQVAFVLVTLGILAWAFEAGRRDGKHSPSAEESI
jgi:hypothetical protein